MKKKLTNLVNCPIKEAALLPLYSKMDVNALLNENTPFLDPEKTNMDILRKLLGDPQLRLLDLKNPESQKPYQTDADIPDYMIDYCDSLLSLPRLDLLITEPGLFEYYFRTYLFSEDCPNWIKEQNKDLFKLKEVGNLDYTTNPVNWRDSLAFFYDAEDHLLLWGRFNEHLPHIVKECLQEYVEEASWPDFKCNFLSIFFTSFKNILRRDD